MDITGDVPTEDLLGGTAEWLTADAASTLAADPLSSIETEYPHYVRSVEGPEGVAPPSEDHPVFYGCYDWHSAVHSHWALVRLLRLVDDHPDRDAIVESIDGRLTEAGIDGEVEYVEAHPAFEKPYGWAWLLALAAELDLWDDPLAAAWADRLAPLESTIRDRALADYLPVERPFRVGTHGNTAFALTLLLDYARTVGDEELAGAVEATAVDCYADDRDAPVAYEPLGWDFLSPTLAEADLMRRVYDGSTFDDWLDEFLPDLTVAPNDDLLSPIELDPDPEEGVALHFVGLNVSKAWSLAGVADALGSGARAERLRTSAAAHAGRGIDRAFTDDYAGAHWLSSFVVYLLTRNAGGIAPGE